MSNTLSPPAIPQAQPPRRSAEREDPEATIDPVVGTRDVIEADDLVEEISIDGMCGVY